MIEKTLRAHVRGSNGVSGDLDVALEYDEDADPLLVALRFQENGFEIIWNVGRDLLKEGADATQITGTHDVKVRAGFLRQAAVVVCLTSPEGACTIWFPRKEFKVFLKATYEVMPAKLEQAEINKHLDRFLAELPPTERAFDDWLASDIRRQDEEEETE